MTPPDAEYKRRQVRKPPVLIASSAVCAKFQKQRGESFATALKRAEKPK